MRGRGLCVMPTLSGVKTPFLLLVLGLGLAVPAEPEALRFHAVAATAGHSLAVGSDGTVWEWGTILIPPPEGWQGWGTENRSVPVQVTGMSGALAVADGTMHRLALKSDGTVWSWGSNNSGQLGIGSRTTDVSVAPVRVSGLAGAVQIAAGSMHSVALTADGNVWTWGYNGWGQLGNGTWNWSLAPARVPGLGGVIAIAAGYGHSLAVKMDGTVWAWGHNGWGQLGDGNPATSGQNPGPTIPVQVRGLTGVVAVAGGTIHSLALRNDGTVWAWGSNEYGQLGDGTTSHRSTPVQVA